jgi:hypothetical protein
VSIAVETNKTTPVWCLADEPVQNGVELAVRGSREGAFLVLRVAWRHERPRLDRSDCVSFAREEPTTPTNLASAGRRKSDRESSAAFGLVRSGRYFT